MVLDGEQIAGIISERDFVRSIAKTEKCLVEKTVKDYMTQGVYWINIDASLDDCMQLMTQENPSSACLREQQAGWIDFHWRCGESHHFQQGIHYQQFGKLY